MTPEHKALVALREIRKELNDGENWTSLERIDELALSAIESLSAQSAQPQAGEPVQDTWFTDRALPVMAMSADVEDNRVLKLHFRRPVTDGDRKTMCDALNVHQASLASPQSANPAQVMELIEEAKDFAERMTGQPWACELVEKLIDALTAAVGAGDPIEQAFVSLCEEIGIPATAGAYLEYRSRKSAIGAGSLPPDAQVEHMVRQFLRWKLPEDFNPDGGIQFVKRTDYGHTFEPVGTNLLDYLQAKAMVQHMLEGLPTAIGPGGQAVESRKCVGGECDWHRAYIVMESTLRENQERCRKLQAELDALSQPHPADERVVEALDALRIDRDNEAERRVRARREKDTTMIAVHAYAEGVLAGHVKSFEAALAQEGRNG